MKVHHLVQPGRAVARPAGAAGLFVALVLIGLPAIAAGQAGAPPPPSQAQGRVITLEEALEVAEAKSEQVLIAQAGVRRATGEVDRARAERFPQLNASASYDRTLASEFEGVFSGGGSAAPCDPFTLRPGAALGDRVTEIERALDCGAFNPFSGGDSDLGDLPFGRENIYRVNLSFSQNLYTGGRIGAQVALTRAGRRSAEVGLASARAQTALDVTQAYYDAALTDQLVSIAQATLRQAEDTLAQVQLAYQAGRQPEFELLRARVARDNRRPVLIRAQAQRTLAYLRLKQLLDLPAGTDLQVAAGLEDPVLPPPAPFAQAASGEVAAAVEQAEARAPVRQAEAAVSAGRSSVTLALTQRLPVVSFNSSYGRVAYAGLPDFGDFRTNWTVGVGVQLPLLTGGRIGAERAIAESDLTQAEAQLQQARELARLDTQSAFEEMRAARAAWEAGAGTVAEATRAYEIAELRYREGISTQLELSDARLLLEQAQANRAQAARDLQVARARVALLPDLPVQLGGMAGGGAATSFSAPTPGASAVQQGQATGTPSGAAGSQGIGATGSGTTIRR